MTNAQVEDITQNNNIVTDITNRMTNCVISVNFKTEMNVLIVFDNL